jgi:hypothetical protein
MGDPVNDYAWFKLLLRAIGVLLLGFSIPSLIYSLWWLFSSVFLEDMGGSIAAVLTNILGTIVYEGVRTAIALYLLLGPERLIRFCLKDLADRCLNCGYPLVGITTPACPECGLSIPRRSSPTVPQSPPSPSG